MLEVWAALLWGTSWRWADHCWMPPSKKCPSGMYERLVAAITNNHIFEVFEKKKSRFLTMPEAEVWNHSIDGTFAAGAVGKSLFHDSGSFRCLPWYSSLCRCVPSICLLLFLSGIWLYLGPTCIIQGSSYSNIPKSLLSPRKVIFALFLLKVIFTGCRDDGLVHFISFSSPYSREELF